MHYTHGILDNAIVCISPFCNEHEGFALLIICKTHSIIVLLCFPWQPQSAQCLKDLGRPSFVFCLALKQGACGLLVFVQMW